MSNAANYKGEDKPWKDEDRLRREYARGNTQQDLADRWGCDRKNIAYWMDKFGIETRSMSDYGKNYMEFTTSPRGYEEWHSTARDGDMYRVHRLLAVAEFGADAVKDMETHHKNGIPWDNRPDNIELVDKAAHARAHDSERQRNESGQYV